LTNPTNLSFQKLHRKIRGEARTPLPISTMIPEGSYMLRGYLTWFALPVFYGPATGRALKSVGLVSGEAGEAGRVAVQDLPGAT
jgi:hypothetical protein